MCWSCSAASLAPPGTANNRAKFEAAIRHAACHPSRMPAIPSLSHTTTTNLRRNITRIVAKWEEAGAKFACTLLKGNDAMQKYGSLDAIAKVWRLWRGGRVVVANSWAKRSTQWGCVRGDSFHH